MNKRKRQKISEEGYWKSATDIMAGVMLVIMLVMMLLLLYVTQIKEYDHAYDAKHDYYFVDDFDDATVEYTEPAEDLHDSYYPEPPQDGGGGGGGGGGDPGDEHPGEDNPDEGHDKCAVFVTVVDEETGNVIKKEGTLFELYADKNGVGGLQTLHTYYPEKVEYKQYQTTEAGTFYLPEKITLAWYSLHNLTAPEGYGLADDFDFEVNESLDWPEPYLVEVPMSPSKNRIYVKNIDSDTKSSVGGETYEVYAAEDIVTLDGTLRCKKNEKVDEFECDENGNGSSEKLYLGEYYLKQKISAKYYALYPSRIDAEVKLTDTEKDAVVVECEKTTAQIILTDEYTGDPVQGAEYSVTGKEKMVTDSDGRIVITDLDKDTEYTAKLEVIPEPYKTRDGTVLISVDSDGNIFGEAKFTSEQTVYMTRLSVDVRDIIFKNSVSGTRFTLYDSSGETVDEWDAVGEAYIIEGLEPGGYTLETSGTANEKIQVNLKDSAGIQKVETYVWTLWDTILVITSVVALALAMFITVRLIRRRRKKNNEKKEKTAE